MYILKDHDGNVYRIGKHEKDIVASLFSPGGTLSGYIKTIRRSSVDIIINKDLYRLNKYGVLCLYNPDCKTWHYSKFTLRSLCELTDQLAVTNHFREKETVYSYK
jgi:hypothetical protein